MSFSATINILEYFLECNRMYTQIKAVLYINRQETVQRLLTFGEKYAKTGCSIIVTSSILTLLSVCFFNFFLTELSVID